MSDKHDFMHDLCDILVRNKAISENQIAGLERAFGKSSIDEFDDFLLEEGIAEREHVLKALSEYFRVPLFDVTGYFFDHALLRNFPKDFLLRNAIIPLEQDGPLLIVIAANPNMEGLESGIRNYTSYDVNFVVGLRRDICDAVKEFYEESITEVDEDEQLGEVHDRVPQAYKKIVPDDQGINRAQEQEEKEEELDKRARKK